MISLIGMACISLLVGVTLGIAAGFVLAIHFVRDSNSEKMDEPNSVPAVAPPEDVYTKAAEAYAVDRKPRRIPWHIRKAQLEAAERTKRKALEEMR